MSDSDPVSHPDHYTGGEIECIDAMMAMMSVEEFRGFLRGNIFKYLWRAPHKGNPTQDLQKAEWYLSSLINLHQTYAADSQ